MATLISSPDGFALFVVLLSVLLFPAVSPHPVNAQSPSVKLSNIAKVFLIFMFFLLISEKKLKYCVTKYVEIQIKAEHIQIRISFVFPLG